MPASAFAHDHLLPDSFAQTPEFIHFCNQVSRHWNINLSSYSPQRIARHLRTMMRRAHVQTLSQLLLTLRRDPQLADDFVERFTINVTRFFRDPHLFAQLEELLRENDFYRNCSTIWSAACSLGMEPYSIAMIMHELAPRGHWSIHATDIDEGALAAASQGTYSAADVEPVPRRYLQRHFTRTPTGRYSISPALKSRVNFYPLDLLDPRGRQPRNCDLILCRNVVIYFTPAAKAAVFRLLARCLRPGGLLFVGATERITDIASLGLEPVRPFFYKKRDAP